jgi:hypothetical protein
VKPRGGFFRQAFFPLLIVLALAWIALHTLARHEARAGSRIFREHGAPSCGRAFG